MIMSGLILITLIKECIIPIMETKTKTGNRTNDVSLLALICLNLYPPLSMYTDSFFLFVHKKIISASGKRDVISSAILSPAIKWPPVPPPAKITFK